MAVIAVHVIIVLITIVGSGCSRSSGHIISRIIVSDGTVAVMMVIAGDHAATAVLLTWMMSIIVSHCSIIIVIAIVIDTIIDVVVIVNGCILCRWSCIVLVLVVV